MPDAQTKITGIERMQDDPPERIEAWLATVTDDALRELDEQLLLDLLVIEQDATRWREIADTACRHADDLAGAGHVGEALELADAVIGESVRLPERAPFLRTVLERLARGSRMKSIAAHLRTADDEAFQRFERLCHAIGPPVIAPLSETLSLEEDSRLRDRLREVVGGFGAQGERRLPTSTDDGRLPTID